jgi:hypothetical protein
MKSANTNTVINCIYKYRYHSKINRQLVVERIPGTGTKKFNLTNLNDIGTGIRYLPA